MLLAHYEKAKTLAKFGSPQQFAEMEKRYDRWNLLLALMMLFGVILFIFGEELSAWLARDSRLIALPTALLIVVGWFGTDRVRAKRDIVILAKRLQAEGQPQKEGE